MAAPLKSVGSTACLPVVHPVIVVVVCFHLTPADPMDGFISAVLFPVPGSTEVVG